MPPIEPVESINDDAFTAAFESLVNPEEKTNPTGVIPAEPVAPAASDSLPAESAEPVAPTTGGSVPAEPTEPVAPTTGDSVPLKHPVEPAKPVDTSANDDMLRRLAALVKEPVPAQPQVAPAPVELFTPEEKIVLEAYDKDWPDQSRAEALRRRADAQVIVDHVFTQVNQAFAPLVAVVQELSTRTQLGDLEAVAPDYNDVRDKVIEWAEKETRPAYRAVYDNIIKRGTPGEVADLIRMYKEVTGSLVTPTVAAPAVVAELPAATRKAVAALAPVKSIRSAPASAGLDPNNFDAAFAVAAEVEAVAEAKRRSR